MQGHLLLGRPNGINNFVGHFAIQGVCLGPLWLIMVVFHGGVAPHFLKLVKSPGLRLHNVNYQIYIIHQYPFCILVPFVTVRNFAAMLFYFFLDMVANGFYLCSCGCFTDQKKIGYRFRNFPHIQRNEVFAFFLQDGLDSRF